MFEKFHKYGKLLFIFVCCCFHVIKVLHRWFSDCFISEMSESRCFGAMVVGGIKMLLGSDGGKLNGQVFSAECSFALLSLSRSMSDNSDVFTQNGEMRS